jgi:hypothetical protein
MERDGSILDARTNSGDDDDENKTGSWLFVVCGSLFMVGCLRFLVSG